MTSADPHDATDVEPFAFTKRTAETDGRYVRFEATVHPSPDGTGSTVGLSHRRWLVDNPDEHRHPNQTEVAEVIAGEYRVAFDGTVHALTEGEEITIPENTPHRHWNPTDQPIRVAHEHHPARQSEALIETLYALAQSGKTDAGGMPNALQLAVINDAYPGHAYLTTLPVGVQKAAIRLLAPIGRLAGYTATHSVDDAEE